MTAAKPLLAEHFKKNIYLRVEGKEEVKPKGQHGIVEKIIEKASVKDLTFKGMGKRIVKDDKAVIEAIFTSPSHNKDVAFQIKMHQNVDGSWRVVGLGNFRGYYEMMVDNLMADKQPKKAKTK